MPIARISNLGEYGIINDEPRFAIPDNALSRIQNVRAFHGRLKNFGGRELQTTAPIEPYGLFAFSTPTRATLWLECGLNAVYAYDGASHTDLTRISGGPYTQDEYFSRWTGGIQGTHGFLCPGHEDAPQSWVNVATNTPLVDMVYDPNGAPGSQTWAELGNYAYAMRPFKSTILAMNIRRGPTSLPSTVQWCDFLEPGATETNWIPATTNSAGEVPLGETAGNIIDGAPLRDDFIIYKEDAVYRCVFTGDAANPFAFSRLPEYVRIINRNCIGVTSEMQVLASRDDVQMFDGNNFRSILNKRLREFYQSQMLPERLFTTFVSVLSSESEVWICFPSTAPGSALKSPDLAIVWNYAEDTLSLTDIPEVRDMDEGIIVNTQDDTYDSTVPADLSYDEDRRRYDESPYQTNRAFLVGAHGTSISTFGEAITDAGTPRFCLAERMGLVLQDQGGRFTDRVLEIREARPFIQSTGPVEIQVGGQMSPGEAADWSPIQTFDPRTQEKVNVRITGRYFGYRVRSQAAVEWDLTDMEFTYIPRRSR